MSYKMKKILFFSLFAVCCCVATAQRQYSLAQLKDSALSANNAVRAARLSIDAAHQQRKEAQTKFFPNVSATGLWFNANRGMAEMEMNMGDYITPELGKSLAQSLPPEALASMGSPISISMMKNGTIGSVMATQPVFAGGQIVNGNKLAKVGEDVSRLQLQLSENEVEKQTEQYFWQLVTLQEKLCTVDAVDTLLRKTSKDVEVAVRAGVAVRNDLLQVQLRQNDIESQRLKLQNSISIVRMLLAQYCGLCDTAFVVRGDIDGDVSTSVSGLSKADLMQLPEYQLLQRQVDASVLQKRLEVGKQMPSVAVGAGYNYHNLMEKNHTFGMIFATVSVPISDWWGGSHAIKRRKIEQQKAEEQLEDNAQLLQIRMQKSWNDVVEARQQLSLAQRSISQAEENLRLNRNYYQAGTSTMNDLLEAQLLYQQARDKKTDAFADLQNKLLVYRQSIGQ